ncbi:MAG: hypothetical protein ACE5F2_03035 [Candidatus Paceibacteria bacterium]
MHFPIKKGMTRCVKEAIFQTAKEKEGQKMTDKELLKEVASRTARNYVKAKREYHGKLNLYCQKIDERKRMK